MATVVIKNVKKVYDGNVQAVKDFNMSIEDKEFIVFVGPSGCGKTTTLRMIAGLEDITEGTIEIDGEVINHVAPKDRDIAMVFQNYALYPHMTVYENMAFALKLRKTPKPEIERMIQEAAQILELGELLKRKPKALSGGQRQRVALGRAIVRNPKVFLMDEPLSNLDAKLRVQMRTEILKLHKRLDATIIYVTHDQTEAMTMGTRIVIMKDGIIQQVDTPQKVYESPVNLFVAGFIGSPQMNILEAQVEKEGTNQVALKLEDKTRIVLSEARSMVLINQGYIGKKVKMGIRPECLTEVDAMACKDEQTCIHGMVDVAELLGSEIYLHTNVCGTQITARVSAESTKKMGDSVYLMLEHQKIHIFDIETTMAIR